MKFTPQMIKFDLKENDQEKLKSFYVGLKDQEYQFWKRNSYNSFCKSKEEVEQKLDYIHNNSCQGKWMLTENHIDSNYLSIRFYESNEKSFSFLSHYMECIE